MTESAISNAAHTTSSDTRRVTAILVVHDGATWLPEVVASLASQTRPIDFTIAVDTGSDDESAKLLKRARVPSITLGRELGFGSAVAEGVKLAPPSTTHSAENEWLWLIHDDCAPEPFVFCGVGRAWRRQLDAFCNR